MKRLGEMDELSAWISEGEDWTERIRAEVRDRSGQGLQFWLTLLQSARGCQEMIQDGQVACAIGAARLAMESSIAFVTTARNEELIFPLIADAIDELEFIARSIKGSGDALALHPGHAQGKALIGTGLCQELRYRDLIDRAGLASAFAARYRLVAAVDRRSAVLASCLPDMMVEVLGLAVDSVTECIQESIAAATTLLDPGVVAAAQPSHVHRD